jgi:predicted nucleic-acid-binding Zn-ribbon protein
VEEATLRRECPMCGEFMAIKERVLTDHLRGVQQIVTRTIKEWTCPECDYFEEYDPDDEDKRP